MCRLQPWGTILRQLLTAVCSPKALVFFIVLMRSYLDWLLKKCSLGSRNCALGTLLYLLFGNLEGLGFSQRSEPPLAWRWLGVFLLESWLWRCHRLQSFDELVHFYKCLDLESETAPFSPLCLFQLHILVHFSQLSCSVALTFPNESCRCRGLVFARTTPGIFS